MVGIKNDYNVDINEVKSFNGLKSMEIIILESNLNC